VTAGKTTPGGVRGRGIALLAVSMLLVGRAQGEEPAGPPAVEEEGLLDEGHALVEQGLTELALRLDSFFGEERRLDLERPGSVLRWRNEVRSGEDRRFRYRSTVLASLRLPAATRWLSRANLVLAGETSPAPAGTLPEETGGPSLAPSLATERAGLELRFHLLRAAATTIDTGAGLRLGLPLEPYLRLRLRHRQPLPLAVVGRVTPALFWTRREGVGASAALDLDRPLGRDTVLRWSGQGAVAQRSLGLEWGSELSLARLFPPAHIATALGAGASGQTRTAREPLQYRIFARARRDLWRSWFFVELEPELDWPLDPLRGRRRAAAITLRVEVHFEGKAAAPVEATGEL